jgi:hypothetical protein
MTLLYIFGCIVLIFIFVTIAGKRARKNLDAAYKEYDEILKKYGLINAPEHCPHRFIQFGQTGVSGVATMTTKWCKICHKYLGPAKLKTSIFGNRWE